MKLTPFDPQIIDLSPLDLRIPSWDVRRLKPRRCPFCGRRGRPGFRRPDMLIVRHCSACSTYFVSPAPDANQLTAFYQTYFVRHRRMELLLHRNDRFLVKEMFAAESTADIKASVLSSLVDLRQKKILEVGFGMGQLLLLLQKEGAEVHGIDLDPDAVAFARDVLHLQDVKVLDLADVPNSERFDLIVLHDLIEHPLRPLQLLQSARSLLAPGGLLSVWTPNASSSATQEQPILFRVDLEHMQYLSPHTCNVIAQLLNLDILHLECCGLPDLKKIRWLSGDLSPDHAIRSFIRRVIGSMPGAARLNAWRKRMSSVFPVRGSYHLFCVFRNPG